VVTSLNAKAALQLNTGKMNSKAKPATKKSKSSRKSNKS
jgi:hypothetical protein